MTDFNQDQYKTHEPITQYMFIRKIFKNKSPKWDLSFNPPQDNMALNKQTTSTPIFCGIL